VLSAVRRGPFKAHFVVPGAASGGATEPVDTPPQLYNLDEDPSEKYDLAGKRPELIAELRKLADDHQKTVIPVKNQIATRTPSKGTRP
jgi:arylsulfatase A